MKKCVQTNGLRLRTMRLVCTQVVLALTLLRMTYGFTGNGLADVAVSGTVTDEKGAGIPGVSIVVKGTTRGTNTDQNGSFQINIPSENTVLVFSFVGYEPQEVAVGNRSNLTISLKTDQKSLNEVVVVGYGTQRKKDLTGAVASVGATEIKNIVANNGLTAIAGLMPGVQITQGNGRPGANPVVRIRGNGSFNASNTPLIVVDGMPLNSADDFNLINPADIESMDVLKDAASAAIYGSRGGNGVIIVTTKKGKSGKAKISLDYYTGVQQVSKYIDLLHRDDDIAYTKETTNQEWIRAGGNPATPNGSRSISGNPNNPRFNYPAILDNPANLPDTDWQREIFQTAPVNNYQVSAQGGTDKLVYYVSANYFQQAGVVKTTNYDRYSVRANVEASVSKRIKAGVNLSPSYAKEKLIPTDGHFQDGIINQALVMPPWISPRTPDGYYGQIAGYPDLIANGFPATPASPIQFFYDPNYKNVSESARLLGSNFVEFQLIDGLSFRTNFNYDWRTQWLNYYRPSTISLSGSPVLTPAFPTGNLANIDSRHEEKRGLNYVWENIISYNKTFAQNHRISALAGYTVQKYTEESAVLTGQSGTYSNDQIQYVTAASIINGTADKQQWSLLSYLARVNYGYKDKYLITAAVRRDGSSRFATDNKWAVFPSVSAAWLVSEEPFLRNNRMFSTVKIRGSYGVTGNFNIGNYTSQGLLGKDNYVFGNGTGTLTNGLAPSNLENRSLSWETNLQTDFGLDIGLLAERIQINLDWYNRKTENLLYARPVPAITGFSSYLGNIGDIQNTGIELNLNGRILTGPFKLSLGGNLTANRNKVLRLGETNAPVYINIPSGTVRTAVGEPFGQFFGYQVTGVFKNQDEAVAGPQWATGGSVAGDLKFRDVDGDGKVTANDRVSLGSSQANFIFGFNGKLSYRNFDLDFIFQGSQGNQALSLSHRFIGVNTAIYNAFAFANDRWKSPTEPGNGVIQRVYTNSQNSGGNTQLNSNWVYDASYLRLRNLTIGYNIPSALLGKVKMSSSRVYLSAQNLFTLTKYIGYNPEVSNMNGGESPSVAGIDYGTYPLARTFTFGVNLGF